MSRRSQTHYYVPGRERKRRSVVGKIKFPMLCLMVIAGAVYCGYVYRPVVTERQPLANATTDTLVATTTEPAVVAESIKPIAPVEEAVKVIPDLSAIITRNGLNQNRAQSWSLAIYDIKNSRWIAQVNPNQQMVSASVYKLYVAYALSHKVPYEEWQSKRVAGHSVKQCVDLMLRVSNNPCGIAIGELVGWKNIDKAVNQYGFNSTVMSNPKGSLTTAADTATFMSELYKGKLFNAEATNFILDSLKNQQFKNGIPAGCKGCKVYNKTGSDRSYNHDVAIVENGTNVYAISIFSDGGSLPKIANVERAVEAALKSVK